MLCTAEKSFSPFSLSPSFKPPTKLWKLRTWNLGQSHFPSSSSILNSLTFLGLRCIKRTDGMTTFKGEPAKSLQSCPTLCDPIDASPPGSPVPGILQARTLEWVAISFSNAWKWKVKVKSLSRLQLLATPWTAAYQAPPSMGFSRQEYCSGVPLRREKVISN